MTTSYTQGDEPVAGFRLVRFLGAGPFSQVWQVTAPGGIQAALKVVRLNSPQALKEFTALRQFKQIRHPHLVPLIAFWLKDTDGKLVDERLVGPLFFSQPRAVDLLIAMGLGDKSLADRLRECREQGEPGIPRTELLSFLADAAQGIDHLNQPIHELGAGPVAVQHCDIKPQNILLAGDAAQVCDLGIARVVGEVRTTAPVGTAAYIAPEVLLDNQASGTTDQYSLAISYYELRTGCLPLTDESVTGAYFTHLQGKLDFSRIPDAERAILARATARQPEERFPSCLAMVHALQRACEPVQLVEAPATEAGGVPASPGPHRPRWKVTVPLLVLVAAVLGSFGAWLTRSSAVAVEGATAASSSDPARTTEPFRVEGSGRAFGDLRAALTAAQDGDTIVIFGNGPFPVRPVQIHGKALTLRAAPNFRPVLRWADVPRGPSWQPLLATDRSLVLEGLELGREDTDFVPPGAEPAHLVWCQRASLRLIDCRLRVPHGCAAVVCRNPTEVDVRSCSFAGHTVAIGIELEGEDPSLFRFGSNAIALEDPEGAAFCIHAADLRKPGLARIWLEGNTVQTGLREGFEARAEKAPIQPSGQAIRVRQAALEFAGYSRPAGWWDPSMWKKDSTLSKSPADGIEIHGSSTLSPREPPSP